MNWLVLRKNHREWAKTGLAQRVFESGLSLLVGLIVGIMIIFSYGLASDWQQLVLVIPVALVFVLLINDLEKLVLTSIAIGVPLNLDVSIIISPYSRNPENVARGFRTLIALTELRVSLVLITLVVGYALWIARSRDSDRKSALFSASTTVPALGFIFFSILSVSQAQDLQLSLFRVAQLIELFLAYFYVANHLRTIQDMQFFVTVSLGGMLAESVLMIVQWITGLSFQIAGIEAVILGPGRIGGTLGHTGPAAGYLSAQALIAGAMIWAYPKMPQKILAAACLGIGLVALVSTGSRIGWIGFAATILMYILTGLRHGWVKRETLILLAIAVAALAAGFYDTIYTRYTADDRGSAEARPKMYRLAWNMIQARPWLGVGAGNQALATRDYYTTDVGDPEDIFDIQAHNAYLAVWAESGPFALLCYIGFFIAGILTAWSCVRSRHTWISSLGAGLGLAIVSLCIQMFTGTFHTRAITLFTWILPALAVSLHHLEQKRLAREPIEVSDTSVRPSRYAVAYEK